MSPTRLQDAVIHVRVETGRARSQLQSLKGDVEGLGEREQTVRRNVARTRDDVLPSAGGEERSRTQGRGEKGEGDSGTKKNSPGELINPLRSLKAVQNVQDLIQGRTPSQMLAATGSFMEAMPIQGLGKFGTLVKFAADAPEIYKDFHKIKQFWNQTDKVLEQAVTKADARLRRDFKGGWSDKPTMKDRTWEEARQSEDADIAWAEAIEDSWSETRTIGGVMAIATGKSYSGKEAIMHFSRFRKFHEFNIRMSRRTDRAMMMEGATGIMADTAADLIHHVLQQMTGGRK